MRKAALAVCVGVALLTVVAFADGAKTPAVKKAPPLAASHSAPALSNDAQNTLVAGNCATCHDDEAKTGGLSLEHFDAAKIAQNPDVAEKMIQKLRAGMMPPPTVKERPPIGDAVGIRRDARDQRSIRPPRSIPIPAVVRSSG